MTPGSLSENGCYDLSNIYCDKPDKKWEKELLIYLTGDVVFNNIGRW